MYRAMRKGPVWLHYVVGFDSTVHAGPFVSKKTLQN